jgi:HK97 gp10 family phage protein
MAGFSLSARVDGLDTLLARLARVQAAVTPPLVTEVLGAAAEVFVETARELAPVGTSEDGDQHPGQLRDSIEKREHGPWSWTVGPTGEAAIYAGVQEHGADIEAKTAPYLEFMVGGVMHRAREVHIPPHPFMGPAAIAGAGPAFESFKAAIAAIIDA